MKKKQFLLCIYLLHSSFLYSMSIVHNFKIAEITKNTAQRIKNTHGISFLTIAFDYYLHISQSIKLNYIGAFESYIHTLGESSYFRVDAAVAYFNTTQDDVSIYSNTQTDDILFTLCQDFHPTKNSTIGISGLLGIPTHPIDTLQYGFFGYGQITPGLQLDGTAPINEHAKLIGGARYFYFVPGTAKDPDNKQYDLSLGNMVDALLGLKAHNEKHGIEFGYNSRWIFGGYVCPEPQIVPTGDLNLHANSFYIVYRYGFETKRVKHNLFFASSTIYISKAPKYHNQNSCDTQFSILNWFSWDIIF